jgi:hypothetical protein
MTDLDTLKESETALRKNEGDLIAEWDKPLTFASLVPTAVDQRIERLQRVLDSRDEEGVYRWKQSASPLKRLHAELELERLRFIPQAPPLVGKVESGILWIPGPFKTDFWSGRRKKPKATQCFCPTCGKKHAKKPA